MLRSALADPDLWKHLSIPFVAGFVGWITNWAAIEMTFRPLRFVGMRPWLGWQGIIPSKAGKMARIFVEKTMFRLGTLPEIVRSMEPERIAEHVSAVMDRRLEDLTDEILFYRHPELWQFLPRAVKEDVFARVRRQMPRLVRALMDDLADNVDDLIDFKAMIVERLEGDPELLNRLFREAGAAEFRFIVRSGLYFGFLFGLVQLAVWALWPEWWILPLFGVLVGYATNWLAINMVFRPLVPVRVGPWTIQGVFLARQQEVAAVWCRLVTTEIVTLQHMIYAMLYGPRAERAKELIRRHIEPIADEVLESYGAVGRVAVGAQTLAGIRRSVGEKAVRVSTDPFDHWPFNHERSRRAESLLRERMEHLPPKEFQDLLRPCFEEDELKLILTGAGLGLVAGFAQLFFVFGGW